MVLPIPTVIFPFSAVDDNLPLRTAVEQRKRHVVFDLGNGGRLLLVMCSVFTTGSVIALFLNNHNEVLELPSYSYRHPLEGVVYLIGAMFFLLVGIWGLWLLLGTFVFHVNVKGKYIGWKIANQRRGQRRKAQIILAARQISTVYSVPLQSALESIPAQTEIEVTVGAYGFVTQIARYN